MFGKIMSISDELMFKYYTLLTDEDLVLVKNMHPKEAKVILARIIIAQYYSIDVAKKAEEGFRRVFASKEIPEDIPVFKLTKALAVVDLIVDGGLAKSKNEARRLINHGAVDFSGNRISDDKYIIEVTGVLKVGSRRFLKIEKI
ncbi:MAG: tyrosine--tRNA ligase, partial [Candidatus Omnitrophica bacterium]|nr:tyrosine--tRNA ligase [Candidatus Omnitrophota bacterium]